jgi:carbon monoxide dehydrogenase subunit G
MHLSKEFRVRVDRARVAAVLGEDETLTQLFPDATTEIIDRQGERRTVRSRYRALGRDGEATFHFTSGRDGGVRFEKVCDGNVWKQLRGEVTVHEGAADTRVCIAMDGKTKGLVPEFTIKVPMQQQLDEMVRALRRRMEAAGD